MVSFLYNKKRRKEEEEKKEKHEIKRKKRKENWFSDRHSLLFLMRSAESKGLFKELKSLARLSLIELSSRKRGKENKDKKNLE
jgi:hypothetical protein